MAMDLTFSHEIGHQSELQVQLKICWKQKLTISFEMEAKIKEKGL